MRIVLVTNGSRGDTEPYAALGAGLRRRGHDIRLVADKTYEKVAQDARIDFFPLDAELPRRLGDGEGRRWLGDGGGTRASVRGFREFITPMAEQFMAATRDACADADAIVFSHTGAAAYHVAEERGVPACAAEYLPRHPTGDHPSHLVPGRRSLGRWGNRLSHTVANQMMWRTRRPGVNEWRTTDLGLPPLPWFAGQARSMARDRLPRLCGYSPAVVPRPRDWPGYVQITGYWFLDGVPERRPSDELVDFVEAGPPPVYVGFGSMVLPDPPTTARMVRTALRRAGARGVLLGDPAELPSSDDLLVVDNAPHDWLFPRTRAVVHHGGAGTTAAGLRAGVPNVVVPFFVDQPFWGQRVHALGAGPRPVPFRELSAGALGDAVERAVGDPAMSAAAARIGERIRAEKGVEVACDLIERWLAGDPPAPGRRRRRTLGL
ncbi:glycosyltransferase [Actinomadura algeriensis]|uniref:UDP:flavonoid glycosyltransferase YjiC (YdhE family) n=1 Tax=Actinomadura algeriensis TaxID=1679523 RepID=A0ABR9JJA6_9ACTN|nr:glycosyltransferase [Actinomadura algeriensis]MBE1530508.1 UDP:flavonoid glycosyltransferase YjiC (YdhE family) [Actinomadura algeriensis]